MVLWSNIYHTELYISNIFGTYFVFGTRSYYDLYIFVLELPRSFVYKLLDSKIFSDGLCFQIHHSIRNAWLNRYYNNATKQPITTQSFLFVTPFIDSQIANLPGHRCIFHPRPCQLHNVFDIVYMTLLEAARTQTRSPSDCRWRRIHLDRFARYLLRSCLSIDTFSKPLRALNYKFLVSGGIR